MNESDEKMSPKSKQLSQDNIKDLLQNSKESQYQDILESKMLIQNLDEDIKEIQNWRQSEKEELERNLENNKKIIQEKIKLNQNQNEYDTLYDEEEKLLEQLKNQYLEDFTKLELDQDKKHQEDKINQQKKLTDYTDMRINQQQLDEYIKKIEDQKAYNKYSEELKKKFNIVEDYEENDNKILNDLNDWEQQIQAIEQKSNIKVGITNKNKIEKQKDVEKTDIQSDLQKELDEMDQQFKELEDLVNKNNLK